MDSASNKSRPTPMIRPPDRPREATPTPKAGVRRLVERQREALRRVAGQCLRVVPRDRRPNLDFAAAGVD